MSTWAMQRPSIPGTLRGLPDGLGPQSGWCMGRTRISLTSTCAGWDNANMTVRAMSSSFNAPAGDRAGEHEVAGAALAEVGEDRADRERNAQHVRVDHRVPLLGALLE